MRNKFVIIFLSFIFFQNISIASEFKFEAKKIQILQDDQMIVANDGRAISSDNDLEIYADKFKYEKNNKILQAFGNGKAFLKSNNLEIKFDKAIFNQNSSVITANGNVEINQLNNKIKILSDEIFYDKKNYLIYSKYETYLYDNDGNKYSAESFKFETNKNLIKLINLKIEDMQSNIIKTELAFLKTDTGKLFGKEINVNLKESSSQGENEARLKARSLVKDRNTIILKKGVFTSCQKRDGCPPWQISAEEIKHNKKTKTINYENALLKFYDLPILYFPKFFHPDPTVKRQSGFLAPTISNSNNSKNFLNIPYFLAIADNKDATFSPRFYNDDKFLLQTEYRQVNLNNEHFVDFSLSKKKGLNQKNHFFYKYKKDYSVDNVWDTKLNFQLQQTSDDTYLKAEKLKSKIIDNYNILENTLGIDMYSDTMTVNIDASLYENLNKRNSDRYEYVLPKINLTKNISTNFNGNLTLKSNSSIRKYDTNVFEKLNTNDLYYSSFPRITTKGFKNSHELLIKNINSENKNSLYKNNNHSFLSGIFQYNSSIPLIKNLEKKRKILEPKISLKIAPPHTRDNSDEDSKVDLNNIYSIDRLSSNTTEGEFSVTYGGDYIVTNKINSDQIFKFNFANNLRLNENDDISNSNQMGEKTSNFFTEFEYNLNKNLKINYNNALRNNLTEISNENFSTEFNLNKLVTKFDYINENNSSDQNSYLVNETSFLFNNFNSIKFSTRENKTKDLTEYYNLMYEYKNDCLVASIEYNKDFYSDRELNQSENIFLKFTFVPMGEVNTPNIK